MTACTPAAPADIEYGPLRAGEEKAVIELVMESFEAAVAPLYCRQGVAEFKKYASLKEMAFRSGNGHFVCVARMQARPVGMIEIRDLRHISMFFVSSSRQQMGIGRRLLLYALNRCLWKNPEIGSLTVNASPNAVPAYRRLGFAENEAEKIVNGIRYVPMQRNLGRIS